MISAELRAITVEDIQLLRYWRNLDHVRSQMIDGDLIRKENQEKWFNDLDKNNTKYFIYSFNKKDVGNVNIKKIDYKKKTFEAGIFCGDVTFLDHWINIWACIKIYDYSFNELKLQKSYATIKNENLGALRLNKSLGYIFNKKIKDNLQYLTLDKEDYLKASGKIKKYLIDFVKIKV